VPGIRQVGDLLCWLPDQSFDEVQERAHGHLRYAATWSAYVPGPHEGIGDNPYPPVDPPVPRRPVAAPPVPDAEHQSGEHRQREEPGREHEHEHEGHNEDEPSGASCCSECGPRRSCPG
jgi:hypothetical protein